MDIKELANRYKITIQGMGKFVRKNLNKINKDSEHAKNTKNGWIFDEEAAHIIDSLREVDRVAIIEEIESEKIKELEQEIDSLKNMLMMTQSQLIESQKETNLLQKELLQSKVKLIETEVSSQQIPVLKAQNKELKEELEKLKKRSLMERILNK